MRLLPGPGALTLFRRVRRRLGPTSNAAPFAGPPADLARFAAIPASRSGDSLRRVLHVGPLSPESGAADLLTALAAWAERHPSQPIEVEWAGVGDLAGVFRAQPLPHNLEQRFVGELDRPGLAASFAAASVMVVPLRGGAPVLEALAAGLVLVGESRAAAMRGLVGPDGPAWSYQAWGRPDLSETIGAVLDADPAVLGERRRAGRLLALGGDSPRAAPGRPISGEVLL